MDEIIEDIDRVIDLLNVLKTRYFFLRTQYNIECNSETAYTSRDTQVDYQGASNAEDLQSFIMIELHLLEYACTYGIYSMTMYATRLKTKLVENDSDPHFLKLLKNEVRSLLETNNEIKNLSVDPYNGFHSYINSFMVYANVLNYINISDTILINETQTKKKTDKLLKKISKINMMANFITFLVTEPFTDFKTEDGRAVLNIALKYRTPRTLKYYKHKHNSI